MARILSGADFGVRFPQGGGVANNDFGTQLAAQLLGQAVKGQQQKDIIALEQQAAQEKADQLAMAESEQKRLQGMFIELHRIKNLKDPVQQRIAIARMGGEEIQAGRDGSQHIEALNAGTPDELGFNIDKLANRAGIEAGKFDKVFEDNQPSTDDTKPFTLSPGQQRFSPEGELIAEVKEPLTEDGKPKKDVQSTEFLAGGGAKVVFEDGSFEVLEPTPEELTIIQGAEDRGVDLQQRRAKGRGLGTGAAKTANTALDLTDKLRSNNLKLKKVIAEVRGGAETGPLADRLPSFRASTRRLIQIKNELGLDVVGSVTFGALSEGELQLALDTALPTSLQGPELVKWAQDKIRAQEKLSEYLEDQAIFLSAPGNTAADWLKRVRAQGQINSSEQQPEPAVQDLDSMSIEELQALEQQMLSQ